MRAVAFALTLFASLTPAMAETVAVYGEESLILRRIVRSPSIDEAMRGANPGRGEGSIVVEDGQPLDLESWAKFAADRFGREPANPFHALVTDSGDVAAIVRADPMIDTYPGLQMVEADTPRAMVGGKWSEADGFIPVRRRMALVDDEGRVSAIVDAAPGIDKWPNARLVPIDGRSPTIGEKFALSVAEIEEIQRTEEIAERGEVIAPR